MRAEMGLGPRSYRASWGPSEDFALTLSEVEATRGLCAEGWELTSVTTGALWRLPGA